MSAGELRRFVGRYEFVDSDTPSLKEARVTLVGDRLTLTIGGATYALVPVAGDDLEFTGQGDDGLSVTAGDSVHFKAAGRLGVRVSFLLEGKRVEHLTYLDEQAEPIIFAIAVPRP